MATMAREAGYCYFIAELAEWSSGKASCSSGRIAIGMGC
jgi:hypothetical protein